MNGLRALSSAVVTGSTGAVGTALCKVLCAQGIKVYALIRPDSKRAEHLRDILHLELVSCDASMYEMIPELISSADAFFHLAWAKTTGTGRNDMDAQIKNVQYTLDAVKAANALGCSVFIGAGSQAEYGRVNAPLKPDTPCFPENGYGMAKLCAGQMSRVECEKLHINHIWSRILSVYGPFDSMGSMVMSTIAQLLRGEKPPLTAGKQIWDFLYADDAANALYQLALYGRSGTVYPLGSGKAYPLYQYIESIRDIINPSLPLGFGEIPYADKQVMHLEADISALKEDTGFEPAVGFEEGIRKTIEYVRRMTNG